MMKSLINRLIIGYMMKLKYKMTLIAIAAALSAAHGNVHIGHVKNVNTETLKINQSFNYGFNIWEKNHELNYQFMNFLNKLESKLDGFTYRSVGSHQFVMSANTVNGISYAIKDESFLAHSTHYYKAFSEGRLDMFVEGKKLATSSAHKYFDLLNLCVAQKYSSKELPSIFKEFAKKSCKNNAHIKFASKVNFVVTQKVGNLRPQKALGICNTRNTKLERLLRKSLVASNWVSKDITRTKLSEECRDKYIEAVWSGAKKSINIDNDNGDRDYFSNNYKVSISSSKGILEEFVSFLDSFESIVETKRTHNQLNSWFKAEDIYKSQGIREFDYLAESTFINQSFFRELSPANRSFVKMRLLEYISDSCVDVSGESLSQKMLAEEKKEQLAKNEIREIYELVLEKEKDYLACIDGDSSTEEETEKKWFSRNEEEPKCSALSLDEKDILEKGVYTPELRDLDLSCMGRIDKEKVKNISLNGKSYIWMK